MSFTLAVLFTKWFLFLNNRQKMQKYHKQCLKDVFTSKMLNLWPRSPKVKTIFMGLIVWQMIKTPFDSSHFCGFKLIISSFVILSWEILINGFKFKVCMLENLKNMRSWKSKNVRSRKSNSLRRAGWDNEYLCVY